ncbi:MAG TPA: hypothetical protein VH595_03990 [Verrucomicrobiae bacterium]|jgi:hypothetical protein|nr:hypothetical protein [Verrucomicrobiae bacterium]
MDSNEYLIQIRTTLEDQGIKLTDAQFSSLSEKVKAGNAAVADLGTELDKTGKHGEEAHEKIHEGAHKSELDHRELRESVSAVAAQFGGLADVGLWLNPMTAALAAVLFLVEKFKERLNEATEAAAQLAAQTEAVNAAQMKAFADAANSAAEAMQQLDIEQEKLNTAYARGDSAMENRVKQYAAEKDAILQVEEAKEQAFEAEIRRQAALGKISKETADATISQAKLQLDAQRGASDESKLQEEITERQKQLAAARGNLQTGKDQNAIRAAEGAETPLASKAAASEESAKQAATGDIQQTYTNWRGSESTFSGNVEALKKQIAEQRQTQQEAEEQGHTVIAERYKHDADALQDILNRQEKYIENLQKIAELDKQNLTQAKAHTEGATDQYRHDQDMDRSGQDRINTLQKQLDLLKQTHAAVQAQHQATANTNAQTEAIEQRQRVQSGHGTPAEQRAQAEQDAISSTARERGPQASLGARDAVDKASILESHMRGQSQQDEQQYMPQLHALLDRMLGYHENPSVSPAQYNELDQKIKELERKLDALESRQNTNRY